MIESNIKVGDVCMMGRPNGMKARCEVVKVNSKSCKVKLLERFGNGRGCNPGHVWNVQKSCLSMVGSTGSKEVSIEEMMPQVDWNPFAPPEDHLIMAAIASCYEQLEPERLSCDGERPRAEHHRVASDIRGKIKRLEAAIGRQVTSDQAYHWVDCNLAIRK